MLLIAQHGYAVTVLSPPDGSAVVDGAFLHFHVDKVVLQNLACVDGFISKNGGGKLQLRKERN